jgi:sugar phosphate isomerase/epimerase
MSISSTVAALARALSSQIEDPALRAHLATLEEMPRYVAEARLDLWEVALMPLRSDAVQGPAHAAALAIFELGRFNLYGEIEEETTHEYYADAIKAMQAAGATPPGEHPDLADW